MRYGCEQRARRAKRTAFKVQSIASRQVLSGTFGTSPVPGSLPEPERLPEGVAAAFGFFGFLGFLASAGFTGFTGWSSIASSFSDSSPSSDLMRLTFTVPPFFS